MEAGRGGGGGGADDWAPKIEEVTAEGLAKLVMAMLTDQKKARARAKAAAEKAQKLQAWGMGVVRKAMGAVVHR